MTWLMTSCKWWLHAIIDFFESTVLGDPTTVGLENLVRGHGHNARDIEKLMRLMARVELVWILTFRSRLLIVFKGWSILRYKAIFLNTFNLAEEGRLRAFIYEKYQMKQ